MQTVSVKKAENKTANNIYPWWGIAPSGIVVLFTGPGAGVSITTRDYSRIWPENSFTKFYGTIEVNED